MHRQFCDAEIEIILDFVPHEAYLIYALISRDWRRIWLQRRLCVSHTDHFATSMELVRLVNGDSAVIKLLACSVAKLGSLKIIDYLYQKYPSCCNTLTGMAAVAADRLDMLTWLAKKDCVPSEVANIAASKGSIKVLKWAKQNDVEWTWRACAAAAAAGQFEVLQFLRKEGCPWSGSVCYNAARHGHLDIVRWAYKNGCPLHSNMCFGAAEGGRLDILQWAHAQGCGLGVWVFAAAAENGSVEMLQWLWQQDCRIDSNLCDDAANGGRIDNIEWAMAHGFNPDEETCSMAAAAGHLHVLIWLRAHGCPWDDSTIREAIEYGHISILAWAHDNGCPFPVRSCTELAIEREHLHILQWIIDRYGYDRHMYRYARFANASAVEAWIESIWEEPPKSDQTLEAPDLGYLALSDDEEPNGSF